MLRSALGAALLLLPGPGFAAITSRAALPRSFVRVPALAPSAPRPVAGSLASLAAPSGPIAAAEALPVISVAVPAAPAAAASAVSAEFSPSVVALEASASPLEAAVWSHAESRGFARGGVAPALASESRRRAASLSPAASEEPLPGGRPPSPRPGARAMDSLLALLVPVQLAVESLGLAVPQFARDEFGYAGAAALTTASALALTAGGLLGGQAVDRFGAEKTYWGSLALRAAAVAALAGLHAAGALGSTALISLFAADYALHYVNYTAVDALAPARLPAAAIKSFGVRREAIIAAVGLAGPIAAAAALGAFGYGALFWAYPAALALSALAGRLALAGRGTEASSAPRPKPATWREAAAAVAADPASRLAVAGWALLNAVSLSIYFLLGPAFGEFVGAAGAASAPQATSLVTGAFAGSGLLGAAVLARLDAAGGPRLNRAMGLALAATGAALLAFWTLPLATPLFFAFGAPVYPLQLLMIPLGAALAVPYVGLLAILQTRLPAAALPKAAGLNRAAAMLAALGFAWAFGAPLAALGAGAASFMLIASALTAAGALLALLGWALARAD